jgi:hypothetical protein
MLSTRAPNICRSSTTSKNTTGTARSRKTKPPPPSSKLRKDSLVVDQLVKDNMPIVSISGAAAIKEKCASNKHTKRKAAAYKHVSSKHVSAQKTAKISPDSEIDFTGSTMELLFTSKPIFEMETPLTTPRKTTSEEEAPVSPPKRIAHCQKPPVNPFRNDIRMGTSGTSAVGSSTRQSQQPNPSTPAKAAKPAPSNPASRKNTLTADDKAAKEALKKLKTSISTAASSKQPSTILSDLPSNIPGMLNQLITADKSVANARGGATKAWKPKPEWRQDNGGVLEGGEEAA